MFYISLSILAIEILGGLYLLSDWLRHKRRYAFMFFGAIGLLLLDWFQIPTILALSGKHIVYNSFNPLFSVSMPLAFLGYIMIYAGIRLVGCMRTNKTAYLFLFLWFLAAVAFYSSQFIGSHTVRTSAWLLAQMVFFLVPV